MPVALLKDSSLRRILAGHPWIYKADLLKIEAPPHDGKEIVLRTSKGHYIGHGFYNSKSQIPIRLYSRTKESLGESFFRSRLLAAQQLRVRNNLTSTYRLVWSEADALPGLIIDRYDRFWVLQTLTLAMDQQKGLIANLLSELFDAQVILERNDVQSRQLEGLPLQKGILKGTLPTTSSLRLGKALYNISFLEGQKTGTYLDQIQNHLEINSLCKNLKVLDCFTYHGGFALHAALGGAQSVEAIDISKEAIEACRQNALLNSLSTIQWKTANVFDELNSRQKAREQFDFIILDPPSFTKSRSKLSEALRGYKEIHLRALKLIRSGGSLATFCCSHHVDSSTFRSVILDAAFDARKILRLVKTFSQSPDHPILPSIPETEYLKGFLFEVL